MSWRVKPPARHVWMAPGLQVFLLLVGKAGWLRSCVRPLNAARHGRWP
jgi:hypothetical protein